MSSGQFRIKVCLESCHARGEAWLRPGSLSRQARDRSPAPRAPRVCAHGRKRCPGRAAASGSPRSPWAVPGRALPGTESPAGLARTCPCCPRSSGRGLRPRGLRAPEVAGLLGTGHGPRPAARRAPASRTRAVPAPAGPGPAAPPVGLPPASRVPRDPYLAPGQGASGGGGRGRRPARLPRFRRSQELNIPPLRAAPMGKTSGQQHHLPPGAEPRAGQPPGHARPGAQRGGLGTGSQRPRLLRGTWMPWLGRGQQGSRFQGCKVPRWDHPQILWGTLRRSCSSSTGGLLLWLVTF